MAHINVKLWRHNREVGPRPCDWCGHPLDTNTVFIHTQNCPVCGRRCYREESKFYTQLGYDGESDVKLPEGYTIVIPK